MILEIILFILGAGILLGGADILVKGSAKLARSFGISPLIIGLTLVAFGTSFPELSVSLLAALQGNSDISIGNIVGSNIANIGLILGIASLLIPLRIEWSTVFIESPFMIFSAFLLFIFSFFTLTSGISRAEGLILLVFFVIFILYMFYMAKREKKETKLYRQYEKAYSDGKNFWKPTIMVLFGLLGVIGGAKFMVDSAINIATTLGVSQAVIALSIIAIGTSLPELVTSIVAAYKNEPAIAIGNIVGSNIFNILLVGGLSATISPLDTTTTMIFNMAVMIFFSIIFLIFAFTKREISRAEGAVLLLIYILYIAYIYLAPNVEIFLL